jgi:hypothetical protein
MKIPIKVALILTLSFGFPIHAPGQTIQQGGSCSVNLIGNGTANLECNSVDAKLAKQVQSILNSTIRNENVTKDVEKKLDQIRAELGIASFGNLKQRCADMATIILNYASDRENLLKEFPIVQSDPHKYSVWQEGNHDHFNERYLPDLIMLRDDLAKHNIKDVQLDDVIREMQGTKYVLGQNVYLHYLTSLEFLRGIAALLMKISGEIPPA